MANILVVDDSPSDRAFLVKLLSHSDARVRTLALAALIDQEDSKFLPEMHALVTNRAATFPGLQPTANAALRNAVGYHGYMAVACGQWWLRD